MYNNLTSDRDLHSLSWNQQILNSYKTQADFEEVFKLTQSEILGFQKGKELFKIQATPYYVSLADSQNLKDPIRKMVLPRVEETQGLELNQLDPLGENKNRPVERLIHRYADRVLFLVTDTCGIYCRYCTRKHFTGKKEAFPKRSAYQEALNYIKDHKEIKEVILSGGDPLTLSNAKLQQVLSDLESIDHVDLIRVGSRMPAACPMRLDEGLLKVFKREKPVFLMTHFNHHQELSDYTKMKLKTFAESGVQIFNQMVLLNGINNSAALVYKLSRELIKARVYPYYMFQCDPSMGTTHLQISIQEALKIQKELWGFASGVALPTYSVDIPSGGGKAYLTPDFIVSSSHERFDFKGFDGVEATYHNPSSAPQAPYVEEEVLEDWRKLKTSKI